MSKNLATSSKHRAAVTRKRNPERIAELAAQQQAARDRILMRLRQETMRRETFRLLRNPLKTANEQAAANGGRCYSYGQWQAERTLPTGTGRVPQPGSGHARYSV